MTFDFHCEQCGKEFKLSIKIILAQQVFELPQGMNAITLAIKCPGCGKKGQITLHRSSESYERITRLRFQGAQKPSMN